MTAVCEYFQPMCIDNFITSFIVASIFCLMSGMVPSPFHVGVDLVLQPISETSIIIVGHFMNIETEASEIEKLAQCQTALSTGTLS